MIGTDIPHTDVVTHDYDDVGLLRLGKRRSAQRQHRQRETATNNVFKAWVHDYLSCSSREIKKRERAIPNLRHDMVGMRE